jgi:hypothetical protein
MIQIVVFNDSTVVTDAAIQAMIPALVTQWNRDLAPAWGLEAMEMPFIAKGAPIPAGAWQCYFLDDADTQGALADHSVTAGGLPLLKIFCKPTIADGASLSVAASHEMCEAAVDPGINMAAQDLTGRFVAYENCDPTEDDRYGYEIDGVLVSDFVLPSWFGYENSAAPFDFMKHCTAPFQVLAAGYMQYFDPATGWQQIVGSKVRKSTAMIIQKGTRRDVRKRRFNPPVVA